MFFIIYSLLISGLITSSAVFLGKLILSSFLSENHIDESIKLVFYFATGLIGISIFVLISGMFGILCWWWFLFVFFLLHLKFHKNIILNIKNIGNYSSSFFKDIKPLIFIIFIFFPMLRILLMLFFHDNSGDAYLYHITVPNYYYQIGKISQVRFSFCYNYPLTIEMIYMLGMIFKTEIGGVLINFWIVLFTLIAIYKFCEKSYSDFAGIIAVCLTTTLPIFNLWVATSHVETAVSMYLIISLLTLLLFFKTGEIKYILLTGFFAGSMIAIKLFYIIPLVFITIIIISNFIFDKSSNKFKHIFLVLLITFLGYSIPFIPYLIKNYLFTNNPFFPFLNGIFNTNQDLLKGLHTIKEAHPFPLNFNLIFYLSNIKDVIDQLSSTMNYLTILSIICFPLFLIWGIMKKKHIWLWTFYLFSVLLIIQYGLSGQSRWFIPIFIFLNIISAIIADFLCNESMSFKKIGIKTFSIIIYLIFIYQQILYTNETSKFPWIPFSNTEYKKYLKSQAGYEEAKLLNSLIKEDGFILIGSSAILNFGRWFHHPFIQEGLEYFKYYREKDFSLKEAYNDLISLRVNYIFLVNSPDSKYTEQFLEDMCVPLIEYKSCVLYKLSDHNSDNF